MQSSFKMEETSVNMTTGHCCTWKSWGLLAKLWRFLVRSFWPGSPGDLTAPGTPESVTSPSSPPADQCTSTKKKIHKASTSCHGSDKHMQHAIHIFKAKAFHEMIFMRSCNWHSYKVSENALHTSFLHNFTHHQACHLYNTPLQGQREKHWATHSANLCFRPCRHLVDLVDLSQYRQVAHSQSSCWWSPTKGCS